MTQNRNKLIALLIGNLANAILHRILERAIDNDEIISKYRREIKTSFEVAKQYRQKINPAHACLPEKDIGYIKRRVMNKVRAEVALRIAKGYANLQDVSVEEQTEKALRELKIDT